MLTREETTQLLFVSSDLLPNKEMPVPRTIWV